MVSLVSRCQEVSGLREAACRTHHKPARTTYPSGHRRRIASALLARRARPRIRDRVAVRDSEGSRPGEAAGRSAANADRRASADTRRRNQTPSTWRSQGSRSCDRKPRGHRSDNPGKAADRHQRRGAPESHGRPDHLGVAHERGKRRSTARSSPRDYGCSWEALRIPPRQPDRTWLLLRNTLD